MGGEWKWDDGSTHTVPSYTNWYSDDYTLNQRNSDAKKCGIMYYDGDWSARDCDDKYWTFCEI